MSAPWTTTPPSPSCASWPASPARRRARKARPGGPASCAACATCWPPSSRTAAGPRSGRWRAAITTPSPTTTTPSPRPPLLTDVSNGQGDYAFAPADLRRQAGAAADRAVTCVLATQVVVDGKRTIWAQQHDALTLQPVAGRNFEPAELSTEESADLLLYLMSLPNPSPALVAAVHAGADYLAAHAFTTKPGPGDGHRGRSPPDSPSRAPDRCGLATTPRRPAPRCSATATRPSMTTSTN
jgi:hypothetical protein